MRELSRSKDLKFIRIVRMNKRTPAEERLLRLLDKYMGHRHVSSNVSPAALIRKLRADLQKSLETLKAVRMAARQVNRIYKRIDLENKELKTKLAALEAERAKVASGKVNCADCNAILARW